MKGMKILTIAVATLFLALMVIAPVEAAKPTVVDEDVWFVAARHVSGPSGYTPAGGIVPGRVWASGDGKILHNVGTVINWNVMRSPTTAGTVQIGSMTTESNFVFDTDAGKGTVNMKVTITLTEADTLKNPYGVGTLEGTLIAKVTTVNPYLAAAFGQIPGYATGSVVTTHGTNAFENAKLTADIDMTASLFGGTLGYEFIFFGTHRDYLDNEGILAYHNPGP